MSRKLRHRSHHGVHANGETEGAIDVTEDRQQQLELLAYGFWQERGETIGSPEEDWFRAEAELEFEEEAATRL